MPRMTTAERTVIATPATGLQVYDTDTNSQWYYNGTVWVQGASKADASKWSNDATNTSVALTNLSDGVTARPAGTEFVVKDNGNLGIGTTTPANRLHIVGTSESQMLKVSYSTYNDLRSSILTWYGLKTTASDLATNNLEITMEGGKQVNNGGSIIFINGLTGATSEKMRILQDGKVGIGTTTPTQRLDVIGGNLRVGTSDTNATTKGGNILYPHYLNSEQNIRMISGFVNATESIVTIGGGDPAFNSLTRIAFFTSVDNTTVNGTERMRITNNGNIGIGVTAPTEKLEVNGAIKIGETSAATPTAGTIRFNTTTSKFEGFDGTAWVAFH